jgi:hypothetical protein
MLGRACAKYMSVCSRDERFTTISNCTLLNIRKYLFKREKVIYVIPFSGDPFYFRVSSLSFV